MTRLTQQQLEKVQEKAALVHQRLVQVAKRKVPQEGTNQGAFFAVLFQLAAQCIEDDVEGFCDLAETMFEEIEAHGQEPQLSEDWLAEITGEKDNFYFSTENLVSDLVSPPKRKRRKKQLSEDEKERLRQEIENAIIDDAPHQSFEQALATAHGEDPQMWIETIQKALETTQGKATFLALRKHTRLSDGELLLGLLLGQDNWIFRQDRFYGQLSIEEEGCGQTITKG